MTAKKAAPIICDICGCEVVVKDEPLGGPEQINGAVIGEEITLQGHLVCLKNVDDKVVIPNRIRYIGERIDRIAAKLPGAMKAALANRLLQAEDLLREAGYEPDPDYPRVWRPKEAKGS